MVSERRFGMNGVDSAGYTAGCYFLEGEECGVRVLAEPAGFVETIILFFPTL